MGLFTTQTFSYPSGSATATGAAATTAVVIAAATRQPREIRRTVGFGVFAFATLTTLVHLYVRSGFASDMVGGLLLGAAIAVTVVTVADIHRNSCRDDAPPHALGQWSS